MEKKYIIELKDNTAWLQWVNVVEDGTVYFDYKYPEDLTPYTEPDLDAVRKEAYDKGYTDAAYNCHERCAFLGDAKKEAYDKCMNEAEDLAYKLYSPKIDEAYQRGLNDAWEAARKIYLPEDHSGFGYKLRAKIFNTENTGWLFKNLSASEAIEKIRAYEQKKEEQITKGDVVRIKSAPEVEILVTHADGGHVSGIALTEFGDSCKIGDQYTDIPIHKVEKTGEHYEIAEILQKMKGSES